MFGAWAAVFAFGDGIDGDVDRVGRVVGDVIADGDAIIGVFADMSARQSSPGTCAIRPSMAQSGSGIAVR